VSRLKQLAEHPLSQRAFRSALARRVTTQLVAAQRAPEDVTTPYAAIGELERRGPASLTPRAPGEVLDVAFIVPGFRRGSGGHTTIANLFRGLEARGHACSVWIDDPLGASGGAARFRAFFGPFAAPVHDDLAAWTGAGVALATGWQTVATTLLRPGAGARAHLVQDDEPEFYPASAERLWAEAAFRLPTITAGTWLAERMRERGLPAASFDLGIDHATYRDLGRPRTPNRVLFYARTATPRRAVPLGLLALEELARRRSVEVHLFGDARPLATPFRNLGILTQDEVAEAYATAAVGVVLSLTNHSLAAQEMAACGLPAVELDTASTRAAFGDSPIVLAPATVLGLADAIERQLDAPVTDVAWARTRTWERAAAAVEAGVRAAL
jgi:hypothetical protein